MRMQYLPTRKAFKLHIVREFLYFVVELISWEQEWYGESLKLKSQYSQYSEEFFLLSIELPSFSFELQSCNHFSYGNKARQRTKFLALQCNQFHQSVP